MIDIVLRFVDRDMVMRFRGGGVGHRGMRRNVTADDYGTASADSPSTSASHDDSESSRESDDDTASTGDESEIGSTDDEDLDAAAEQEAAEEEDLDDVVDDVGMFGFSAL
jgi:hypothetical protein